MPSENITLSLEAALVDLMKLTDSKVAADPRYKVITEPAIEEV